MRLVLETEGQHALRWQALMSIAAKIGCAAQTLNDWVKKAEIDGGRRAGILAEKMKPLERENRELRQANEILRKVSAYSAVAQLDCRSKGWGGHRRA